MMILVGNSRSKATPNHDEDGRFATGSKEPWDRSSAKAKELTLDMFGTPEEVAEMARMPRTAASYGEVRSVLEKLVDKPLTSKSNLVATISKNSINEILSGRAVNESFDKQAHVQAAVNVDRLFSNAIEPWKFELNPNKQNESLKDIRRLYAPMEYRGKISPVKITVKELVNPKDGNRLYSLEAIDVEMK